jgi:hypothetical protein
LNSKFDFFSQTDSSRTCAHFVWITTSLVTCKVKTFEARENQHVGSFRVNHVRVGNSGEVRMDREGGPPKRKQWGRVYCSIPTVLLQYANQVSSEISGPSCLPPWWGIMGSLHFRHVPFSSGFVFRSWGKVGFGKCPPIMTQCGVAYDKLSLVLGKKADKPSSWYGIRTRRRKRNRRVRPFPGGTSYRRNGRHVQRLGHIFRLQLFGTSVHDADVIIVQNYGS